MKPSKAARTGPTIGRYTLDEFIETAEQFHGSAAPGLLLGGFMVDAALRGLTVKAEPAAICETPRCLPDAVQILTPCTMGNGRLTVHDLGHYAACLYDRADGRGVRVHLDPAGLDQYPQIKAWHLKLNPGTGLDPEKLRREIVSAGAALCRTEDVRVQPGLVIPEDQGGIVLCPVCGGAYPARDGETCRICQGESPYVELPGGYRGISRGHEGPKLKSVPVEQAVGKRVLHDMTRIEPGESKGAKFKKGQEITVGDVCSLQRMGRKHVYVDDDGLLDRDWIHEDIAAEAFALAMCGQGVVSQGPPSEGKVNLAAERDGLFMVDVWELEQFNLVPGVMCASRRGGRPVKKGERLAGTRAIPLYLPREDFKRAMDVLKCDPVFRVLPMRRAGIGTLITGNEVFDGLIEDKFEPLIKSKAAHYGCEVVKTVFAPDDRRAVRRAVDELICAKSEIIVTTAGLSVDPDDLTRQALVDAGARDVLYGMPVLPGAMTLLARIGDVRVIGVPACALFYKTTALDILLPRVLAGVEITRADLAELGHGGMCLECKKCVFPACPFGA